MLVYDAANQLAEDLKKSEVYTKYKEVKERLFADPEKKKQIEEFETLKQEIQLMELRRQNNEEIDEEAKKTKMADMYNVLVANQDIKEYFDCEIAFSKLMYDVNKIIGEAVKDVL